MTANELEIFKQSILDDVRVMMQTTGQVTQYIGARYVPLFADPLDWNGQQEYEPLTIVLHQGNSYTSRQFVPKGVSIDNTEFWALTGNYNAQVEQYRQELEAYIKLVDGKAPIDHADETPVYGVGSASEYGHVKLTDKAGKSGVAEGIASTPAGVEAAITRNAAAFSPAGVSLLAANGMLACARTYVDASANHNLKYKDGTGEWQSPNTISCSTFVRAVLDGIPYSDYLPGNAGTLSKSQLFNRYGYGLMNSPFKHHAKATSREIYEYFKSINLAFPSDAKLSNAVPGCIFFVGDSEGAISHCGIFVCKIGDHCVTVESSSRNPDGVNFNLTTEFSSGFIGVAYPNMYGGYHNPKRLLIDQNIVASHKNQMLFMDVSYEATGGSAVNIGGTTITVSNTGMGEMQAVVPVGDDVKKTVTVNGVDSYTARIRESLISDDDTIIFTGTQEKLISMVKAGEHVDIYSASGSDGIEQGLYNVFVSENIASETKNITLLNLRNNSKRIYECSLPNDTRFTKVTFA